jgi:hypothetical protein
VEKEDEIIVMVVPDYQMLEYVEKIANGLADDPVTKSVKSLISTLLRTFSTNIKKAFLCVLSSQGLSLCGTLVL